MYKNLVILGVAGLLLCAVWLPARDETPGVFESPTEAVNPWTHLRFQKNPDNFQFAIVTDRTGGHRSLVFQNAVRKLNLLNPEFVISVGDLIEGGTRDRDRILTEWKEFQGFVEQLSMPFFHVPGNHDIGNADMAKEWRSRHGRPYYHFVYKNTLFLALNSEASAESDQRVTKLGDEQLAYFEKVLAENPNVRWTLVFLHKPLWIGGPNRDGEGTDWLKMEKLLAGRKYTVFCGHVHRYETWTRNGGNRYIQLATTGGSSQMRGKEFGEFDHVTWITMSDEGPVMAHLLLDGIVSFDVKSDLEFDREAREAQAIQRKEREEARQKRALEKRKDREKSKEPESKKAV